MDISRRFFIGSGAFLTCAGVLGFPGLTLAALPTDKRLLTVILRGGMDGMGAVIPYGDKNYSALRKSLIPAESDLLSLDGFFTMPSALQPLHDLYLKKELLVLHATASPYRDRSHFDAQNLLENGSMKPHLLSTGWLGRSLTALSPDTEGLSLGAAVPLVLQGGKKILSYTPSAMPEVSEDFVKRVAFMYQHDDVLRDALESSRMTPDMAGQKAGHGKKQFVDMMNAAAKFMTMKDGARVAAIDLGGWDTHANQIGRLPAALGILADGIAAFKTGMGADWQNTAVVVITEFGRTAATNGTNGTDHGTASVAFLAGGGINGGKVAGDWPGLAPQNLYENRDLYPANDLRALLKGVLQDHMGIDQATLSANIFPDSQNVAAMKGLFA